MLTLVFLLLGGRPEALPREGPGDKVHEDVPERLHIVASTLFNAQVSVDAGVASCAGQILVFPVGNVSVGPSIAILLRQAEIYNVNKVSLLAEAPEM